MSQFFILDGVWCVSIPNSAWSQKIYRKNFHPFYQLKRLMSGFHIS